jgi:hypothetical protein
VLSLIFVATVDTGSSRPVISLEMRYPDDYGTLIFSKPSHKNIFVLSDSLTFQ